MKEPCSTPPQRTKTLTQIQQDSTRIIARIQQKKYSCDSWFFKSATNKHKFFTNYYLVESRWICVSLKTPTKRDLCEPWWYAMINACYNKRWCKIASQRRDMPSACFNTSTNVSTHWKQTKRTVPLVCMKVSHNYFEWIIFRTCPVCLLISI